MTGPSFRAAPALKRLSQNFLTDPRVAARIVECFAPAPADHVLEVGPGRGALTRLVAGRVERLVALEIDRRLSADLAGRYADDPRVDVLRADVLETPLASLRRGPALRVLSNLPYRISSPFLLRLIDQSDDWRDALILLQRELAERLLAPPKTAAYGSLTVLVACRLEVSARLDVAPAAFRPPPKVHSRLLHFAPRPQPLVEAEHEPTLRRLLRAGFDQRRKMIGPTLVRATGLGGPAIEALLAGVGARPTERPQDLPPGAWASLARDLSRHLAANPAPRPGGAPGESRPGADILDD